MSDTLYALDFDGVICDSAIETSITGWKVASTLWPKMPADIPAGIITNFKHVRPALETGYEAILIVRLLYEGVSADALLTDFANRMESLLRRDQLDTQRLKILFGETRDQWISQDLKHWLAMNPLFEGVAEKLAQIPTDQCYIITTKQERFVHQILNACDIKLADENVFGLDRNRSKQQILADLLDDYPEHTILFVEDRLPTLVNIINDQQLSKVKLFFADWGYNTEQDKQAASELSIDRIKLEQFSTL